MLDLTTITTKDLEKHALAEHEPRWLRQQRVEAWMNFQACEYPNWRRVKMEKIDLVQSTRINQAEFKLQKLKPALAAQGVIFCDMKTAVLERADHVERYWKENKQGDIFSHFHQALWNNGYFLYVPSGLIIDEPFQIQIFQKEGHSVVHSNLIIADSGSEFLVEETYESAADESDPVVCSVTTDVVLEEKARMKLITTQNWGKQVYDLSTRRLFARQQSHLRALSVLLGAHAGRTIISANALQPEADIEHDGMIMGTDDQNFKMLVNMTHEAPDTRGMMKYKAMLKDKAYSSLDGLITILPNAKKSDSRLEEHTLMLSEKARCDALPALDIRASDVKVSHSAYVSQADAEKIFYLMSRGLSEAEARSLMIQGFFENLLELIPYPRLYARMKDLMESKMFISKS